MGELAATIGREVRSRKLAGHEAFDVLATTREFFDQAVWLSTTATDVLIATEFVTRFDLGLRLPDAIHLSITQRHGATLVTTDKKQGDAAAALGIGYVDPTRPV